MSQPNDTLPAHEIVLQLVMSWNQLKAWSSTVVIVDRDVSPSSSETRRETSAIFVLDRQWRQLKWGISQERGKTGVEPSPSPIPFTDLIKHGAHYHCVSRSRTLNENSGTAQIVINELTPSLAIDGSLNFDPILVMTAGLDRSELALSRLDPSHSPALSMTWRQDSSAGAFHPVLTAQTDDGVTIRLILDSAPNPLIKVLERTSAANEERWSLTYQEINSIHVPQTVQLERKDAGDGERTLRTFQFLNSKVNSEVPRSEFALDQIGANRGDLVRDQRAEVQYIYHGSELKSKTTAPSALEQIPMNMLVVINLGIWILALVGFLVIQKRRQAAKVESKSTNEINVS